MSAVDTKPLDRMSPEVLERFIAKFDITESGCWQWTAATRKGYGAFAVRHGYVVQAHRASFRHFIGPIPDDMVLDHLCRNPLCVNPKHLDPVPQGVNLVRGDGWSGRNIRKTHCPSGHEYSAENTYTPPSGGRYCRTCRQIRKESRA
ncbi:HNH endonuclease signature motif containing protein [Microbacterium sp. KR10-403]|uniref:HNH endonuclease signature motif containing protein n=1 Tax=Microbacterium sp. KR10-403 TaxID=3158581 RepID=UPI0032E49346